MNTLNIKAIVLAAGKSTRFKTKKSKLLFSICGQSMILYPLKVLAELNIPMTVVLGHQADVVQKEIERAQVDNVSFVIQQQQLGTGHAVACTQNTWEASDYLMVLYGDMPLITAELISVLIEEHMRKRATITFTTTFVMNPTGYGRVIEHNHRYEIVEEKDCTPDQRQINKINAGIYLINRAWLQKYINVLPKSPVTGEIYLVDLIKMACDQELIVQTLPVPFDNVRGVNTLHELWAVEQIKRSEFIKYWMSEGVQFELAQSIHIDINVKIGPGSFIGTGVHLLGNTVIGEECFVGAFSIVENTTLGDNSTIHSHSVIQDSTIGTNSHLGPFARLRNNVTIGNNVEVGNFVEIKKTTIGNNSSTKHLSYIGDATIGESVNIGAGTITCNYDGVTKHPTIIENEAFIGSNNTLVAPITIGRGAYTAAGSTITQDVPEESLAIGRSRQENKDDYAKKIKQQIQENATDQKKNNLNSGIELSLSFRGAMKTNTDQKENF